MTRYRFSSRKAWQKPPLKTGPLYGEPPGPYCQWLDSVRPAMNCTEKSTKDQAQLLADARKAGKDALDSILELIPEEQEPHLTPVFPKATHLLAPVLSCGPGGTLMRPCETSIPSWWTLVRNIFPRSRPGPSSTPSCRCPVPSGRRWTTWPRTRSSFRAR